MIDVYKRQDDGYFLSVAFGLEGGDVALAKSSLGNGGFVLADSCLLYTSRCV